MEEWNRTKFGIVALLALVGLSSQSCRRTPTRSNSDEGGGSLLGESGGRRNPTPLPPVSASQFRDVYKTGEAFDEPDIVDGVLMDDPPPKAEVEEAPEEELDFEEDEDEIVAPPAPSPPMPVEAAREPTPREIAAKFGAALQKDVDTVEWSQRLHGLPREEVAPSILEAVAGIASLPTGSQRTLLRVLSDLRLGDEPGVRDVILGRLDVPELRDDALRALAPSRRDFGVETFDFIFQRLATADPKWSDSQIEAALSRCGYRILRESLAPDARQRLESHARDLGLATIANPRLAGHFFAIPLISAVRSGRDIDPDLVALESLAPQVGYCAIFEFLRQHESKRELEICSKRLASFRRSVLVAAHSFEDARVRETALEAGFFMWPSRFFLAEGRVWLDAEYGTWVDRFCEDDDLRVRTRAEKLRDALDVYERRTP